MKWIAETPTEPGFYWFYSEDDWSRYGTIEIVEVSLSSITGAYALPTGADNGFYLNDSQDDWRWQGPLEAPEPPEAE